MTTTDLILANFDAIADAPGGVGRLRQLILQLAVQGRLVEQDPDDEPASMLLEKARAAKIASGVIIKEHTPYAPDSVLLTLPATWRWTTLAELGFINPRNVVADDQEVAFVPMTLVPQGYGEPVQSEVRLWRDVKKGFTHFAEGDVVLAKITPCFQNGKAAVMRELRNGVGAGTTELHVFRPVEGTVLSEYVYIHLKSPSFVSEGIPRMTGTAGQKRVPNDYFAATPFPLPPLAEQRRIIARVDALMRLCDELEARQTWEGEERRRLLAAQMDGLLGARDAGKAAAAWARLSDSFDLALAAPEDVAPLRRAVLQLAVQGRLVEQDAAEEAANVHIETIRKSSDAVPMQRKVRGYRPERTIHEDEVSHPIPDSWALLTVESACSHIVDCLHTTPTFTQEGYYCIDTNCISPGKIHFDKARRVNRETFSERTRRLLPSEGDVLFSREGTIGISVVVPKNVELCLGQRMMMYRPNHFLDSNYFVVYLSSPFFLEHILNKTTGTAAKHVNIGDIRKMPLLIPPLAEQRRIVARVEQLMALCDELEARLREERAAAERLSEGLCRAAARVGRPEQVGVAAGVVAEQDIAPAPLRTPPLAITVSPLDRQTIYLAWALKQHLLIASERKLGLIKAEKMVHLAEAHGKADFGRHPTRLLYGPADAAQLTRAIDRGREWQAFDMVKRTDAKFGNQLVALPRLDEMADQFEATFGAQAEELARLVRLLAPRRTRHAEAVATLYAAWNDLLRAGKNPGDDELITAFYAWHSRKEGFSSKMLASHLEWMREHGVVPDSTAKPTRLATAQETTAIDVLVGADAHPTSQDAQSKTSPETLGATVRRLLAERGALTNGDLQVALNIDAAAARGLLKQLVALGLARQEGERRGARYVALGLQ